MVKTLMLSVVTDQHQSSSEMKRSNTWRKAAGAGDLNVPYPIGKIAMRAAGLLAGADTTKLRAFAVREEEDPVVVFYRKRETQLAARGEDEARLVV